MCPTRCSSHLQLHIVPSAHARTASAPGSVATSPAMSSSKDVARNRKYVDVPSSAPRSFAESPPTPSAPWLLLGLLLLLRLGLWGRLWGWLGVQWGGLPAKRGCQLQWLP